MEHKTLDFGFEVKEIADAGAFTGLASTFEPDQGGDIVDPKAFDETIAEAKASGRMPKMLWQHDPSQVIGIWDEMKVDGRGLEMHGRLLLDLPKAKEAHILLKHKAIEGLSIGYQTKNAERDGEYRRITNLKLWETSLVTFPMNTGAGVTDVKQLTSVRDVERILRDAGVANKFAKLVATHGFERATEILADQRDADDEGKSRSEELSSIITQLKGLKETLNA